MTLKSDRPDRDEIEVSVFSRGYGESIVIHAGYGSWIIIDSLNDATGLPVAAKYLQEIGIDLARSVSCILFSHWHDDHVGGAAHLATHCENATVALPAVLCRDEFKTFLRRVRSGVESGLSSGMDELFGVLQALKRSARFPRWCLSDRLISDGSGLYRLDALSPTDGDFTRMLEYFESWQDDVESGAKRLVAPARNDTSVATVLTTFGETLLFGADLEVTKAGAGWENVHSEAWRDRDSASFFKIAHHGSRNGDYDPVWADMLVSNVVAVLTPWSRGKKLPQANDVGRILGRTSAAHSAARVRMSKPTRRLQSVERAVKEAGIKLSVLPKQTGHVRFRKQNLRPWSTEYVSGDSCHLSSLLA